MFMKRFSPWILWGSVASREPACRELVEPVKSADLRQNPQSVCHLLDDNQRIFI
jgi:hypothetical protein